MTTRWDFRDFVIVGEDVESSTFNGIIDNLSEDDAAIVTRPGDIPYASDANQGQVLGVSGEAVGSVLRSTSTGLAWEAPQQSTSSSQNNVTFGRFKRYLGLPRSNALSFISVDDVDEDSATINVSIDNVTGGTETVYLRFRIRGTGRWSTTRRQNSVLRSTSFSLTNLDENTIYEVQVSLFSGFSEFLSSTFLTERALNIENGFGVIDTLISPEDHAQLLCSNDYIYLGGNIPGGTVNTVYYAYRKEDGARVWSKDIIIPYVTNCRGYINIGENILYFTYVDLNNEYLGSYDLLTDTISTSPVRLDYGVSTVGGIYVENEILHTVSGSGGTFTLYRFNALTGARLTRSTLLTSDVHGHLSTWGMLSDGIYLWLYSRGFGYAFRLDTHERVESQDFTLPDSYGDFSNITWDVGNPAAGNAVYDGIDLYAYIGLSTNTPSAWGAYVIGKYNWRTKTLNAGESIHIYHDRRNSSVLVGNHTTYPFISGGIIYIGGTVYTAGGNFIARPYSAFDLNSYARLPGDDIFNNFGVYTIYDGTHYFGVQVANRGTSGTINKYSLSNGVVTVVDSVTLSTANRSSYGRMYSDGTYLWILRFFRNTSNRIVGGQLNAIEIDTMTLDSTMTISVGFTVYSSFSNIISDGVLFWLQKGAVLEAWNKSSGVRVSASDITLSEASRCVFSDGVTVWAKALEGAFYMAYTLATGSRDFEKDFMLHTSIDAVYDADRTSFVVDDNYMYINYSGRGDHTPAFSRNTGDIVPTEGLYVHARFGWINSSGILYYYDHTTGRLFLHNIATRTTTNPRVILSTTQELGGLWGDEDTSLLWAVIGGTIRAYDLDTYVEDASKRINISTRLTRNSVGLASNGSTFWVASRTSNTLYAYDISTLSADASKDIDMTSKLSTSRGIAGIWTDGARMYVSALAIGNIVTFDLPV